MLSFSIKNQTMTIKKIFYSVVFASLFVSLSFVSCSKDVADIDRQEDQEPVEEFVNNGITITVKKVGTVARSASVSDSKEQYLFTAADSANNKEVSAKIIKENSGNGEYTLYHYDPKTDLLIARLFVKDDVLQRIAVGPEDLSNSSTIRRAAATSCFEDGYNQYKDFYNQGDWREIACDIGNIFAGACTIGGVIAGAVNCI